MGENNVKEIKCESVKEFIQRISYGGDLYKLISGKYIYRGESSDEYKLIPSALRPENHDELVDLVTNFLPQYKYANENSECFQMAAEFTSLNIFYMLSDYRGLDIPNIDDFRNKLVGLINLYDFIYGNPTWLPLKYIELAGLAQHYGAKTRLLDWSQDINVAIYFAISGLMKFEKLKKPKEVEYPKYIVLWVLDTTIFKAPEENTPSIFLYTPKYAGNPNLCAQKGVFSVNCIYNDYPGIYANDFTKADKETKSLDDIIKEIKREEDSSNEEPILYKILIPTPQDDELYNYLANNGYDASLIFPGYDGVTKTIKDELYWKKLKRKNEQESK